jgi:hypothetical protein
MRRRVDQAGIRVTVGHSNADDPSNAEGVSNPVVRRIGSRRTRSDVAGTQYTH